MFYLICKQNFKTGEAILVLNETTYFLPKIHETLAPLVADPSQCELMTTVFVEQPPESPRSANNSNGLNIKMRPIYKGLQAPNQRRLL